MTFMHSSGHGSSNQMRMQWHALKQLGPRVFPMFPIVDVKKAINEQICLWHP